MILEKLHVSQLSVIVKFRLRGARSFSCPIVVVEGSFLHSSCVSTLGRMRLDRSALDTLEARGLERVVLEGLVQEPIARNELLNKKQNKRRQRKVIRGLKIRVRVRLETENAYSRLSNSTAILFLKPLPLMTSNREKRRL